MQHHVLSRSGNFSFDLKHRAVESSSARALWPLPDGFPMTLSVVSASTPPSEEIFGARAGLAVTSAHRFAQAPGA